MGKLDMCQSGKMAFSGGSSLSRAPVYDMLPSPYIPTCETVNVY